MNSNKTSNTMYIALYYKYITCGVLSHSNTCEITDVAYFQNSHYAHKFVLIVTNNIRCI